MTTTERRIRVLLVDPDGIDRAGLKCLLRDEPSIDVVAEAAEAGPAAASAHATLPDVIVVDADALPAVEEIATWLSSLPTATRLLVLCRENQTESVHPLFELGVMGIVLKGHGPAAVTKAITKVHAGEPWIDRRTVARLLAARSRPGKASDASCERCALLSDRERQIVELVAKGQKNRKIAETLHIREATVRNHLSSIFRKLQVADRLELAVFAHRHQSLHRPTIEPSGHRS